MKNLIQKGGKYYEECDVVMLPTKAHSHIIKLGGKLHFNTSRAYPYKTNDEVYHLYVLSKEEIKEGDWAIFEEEDIDFEINIIIKNIILLYVGEETKTAKEPTYAFGFSIGETDITETRYVFRTVDGQWYRFKNIDKRLRKIIATTDESLALPSIPKEFLKQFCEAGGIWKVLVEYQQNYLNENISIHDWGQLWKYKLKVSSDNTITIHPIEERMYSKEEVMELMEKSWDMSLEVNRNISNYYYSSNGSNSKPTGFNDFVSAKDWMKKQLK